MSGDINWKVKMAIKSILELTRENAIQSQQISEILASLNWQQAILEAHQTAVASQMARMKSFIQWSEEGGSFCDDCEYSQRVNYVGEYHYGPQYSITFAWPHTIRPNLYQSANDISARRYCLKCFHKMQIEARDILLRKYRDEHPEVSGLLLAWTKRMINCNDCWRLFPERSGYTFAFAPSEHYCLHCIERAVPKQFIQCKKCGKKIVNHTDGYCYDCYPMKRSSGSHVSSHLSRARKSNTADTLTKDEWDRTVAYFEGKCAYCLSRPFQSLDHFVPLISKGGTTADNCVPACQHCNSVKGSAHPDNLGTIFPRYIIDHIKTYLQGDQQGRIPFSVSCRNLVVV